MSINLLETKLHIPYAPAKLIARRRLADVLSRGLSHKLTLVSAPAGFGKTTLVGSYAANSGKLVAWLSLDEGDNDLRRFLAHLIAALNTVHKDVGVASETLLQSASAPVHQAILTPLINELSRAPEAAIFVLDDYHIISEKSVHKALDFFLEHLPPKVHVLIASRADPPLALSRLRGQGQLTELRASDLRFTPEEAELFLNEAMGLDLLEKDIEVLEGRTEGWIVGLQLAALSLQSESNRSEFIRSFAGDNRYVIDYLLDEVFSRQTPEVQDFLLKTSILTQLTAPLCAELTASDVTRAQAMLESLEGGNLFVVPLDNKRRWYRYHQLFADLLCHRLHTQQPNAVADLHGRAATWYETQELFEEALDHHLKAQDFESTADLLGRIGKSRLWQRSAVSGLHLWLKKLPEDLRQQRPNLLLLHAWIYHTVGDLEGVQGCLDRLARFKKDTQPDLQAEALALQALVTRMEGRLPEAVKLFDKALAQLPEDDLQVRSRTLLGLAETLYLSGELTQAAATFLHSSEQGLKGNNIAASLFSLWWLAHVQKLQGKLRAAEVTCERMTNLVERHADVYSGINLAYVQLGRVYCERNELELATQVLEAALAEADRLSNPRMFVAAYVNLARVLAAQKKDEQALAAILEAEAIVNEHHMIWTWGLPPVDAYRARIQLMQGNANEAVSWAKAKGFSAHDAVSFREEIIYLTFARVLIAEERLEEALKLLATIGTASKTRQCWSRVMECEILRALAYEQLKEREKAQATLTQAINRAQPEGYLRLFLDEGEALRQLLITLPKTPYVTTLLDTFPTSQTRSIQHEALLEPLKDREMAILRLMAGRLSNKEIAKELDLSVNTVKWYARIIYDKLAVGQRKQAVSRAKEIGLL